MPHPTTTAIAALLQTEKARFARVEEHAAGPMLSKSEIAELRLHESGVSAGRRNLERFDRAFRFLVEHGGVKLGTLQAKLFKCARVCLLRRMFGDELVNEMDYLRQRYGITKIQQTVAVLFPRRVGKTTVQTIVSACVMVSQPDGNVCSFNLRSRQSKAWFSQTLRWMEIFKQSPEFNWTEVSRNGKESIDIVNCTGTRTQLSSYPGPADSEGSNFRGMGERLMLMNVDEFFFFKPSVYPTILPLLANGASLLLTSSQNKDPDSPIRRMINAKFEDGEDAVLRFNWLQSCARCKAARLEDKCTHIEQQPQHFQKHADQRRVRALMGAFGDGSVEREMGNMMSRNFTENVFDSEWIDFIADPANSYSLQQPQRDFKHFFVGYDPAGEGFSKNAIISVAFDTLEKPFSAPYTCINVFDPAWIDFIADPANSYNLQQPQQREFEHFFVGYTPGIEGFRENAIVSVAFDTLEKPYTCILIGGESFASRATETVTSALVKHIEQVRQLAAFRHATCVLVIESNMVMIADTVRREIERSGLRKICIMAQDPKRQRDGTSVMRTGTRTTRVNKPAMVRALAELMAMRAIRFAAPFLSVVDSPVEMAVRQKVTLEIRCFKRVVHPPRPGARQPQWEATYQGIGSDGAHVSDDFMMAIGFILLNRDIFYTSPSYSAHRV